MTDNKINETPTHAGVTDQQTASEDTHGRVHRAASKMKDKTVHAYESSREAVKHGAETTRVKARKLGGKTGEQIDSNPLAVLFGGLAIGAAVGALLPATKRESELLGKTGRDLNKRARSAFEAAKEAGSQQIDELGLNGDAVKNQFKSLVDKAGGAAKTAGKAAAEGAKNPEQSATKNVEQA